MPHPWFLSQAAGASHHPTSTAACAVRPACRLAAGLLQKGQTWKTIVSALHVWGAAQQVPLAWSSPHLQMRSPPAQLWSKSTIVIVRHSMCPSSAPEILDSRSACTNMGQGCFGLAEKDWQLIQAISRLDGISIRTQETIESRAACQEAPGQMRAPPQSSRQCGPAVPGCEAPSSRGRKPQSRAWNSCLSSFVSPKPDGCI